MTQVPEAYEQAKNHILFHNYCITTKIGHAQLLHEFSQQGNMLCDKYVFSL